MEKRLELVNTVPAAPADSVVAPVEAASHFAGVAMAQGSAAAKVEDRIEGGSKHHGMTQTIGWEVTDEMVNAGHPGSPYYPHGIKDRFIVRREIACGGMGSIYEVYDTVLQRRLAMKRQHPTASVHSRKREAFVEEARISARLDHPNIVPVHDLEVTDPEVPAYFVMKLVEGESLYDLIHRRMPRPPTALEVADLMDAFERICDAVSFAHSRSVLHLDLKPENIMHCSHGQVYVMDWGIALECRRDAAGKLHPLADASPRGTPAYMAPEQVRGDVDHIDEHTDVHGLGAIFYEFLAGHPPYPVSGGHAAFEKRRDHPELRPRDLRAIPSIPPRLAQLVMASLEHDPALRPADVRAFKDTLVALKRDGGWSAHVVFAAGETIVEEGTPGDSAFIIQSGSCDVYKYDGSREIHLRRMGPGDVFGEMALLTAAVRSATVRAAEEVEVVEITRHHLDHALESQGWLGTLIRALANRFRDVDNERLQLRRLMATGGDEP